MPINSASGIITPATYWGNLACFYGGRRVRKGWDDKQFTALCTHNLPEQIPLHLLRLQLLEVAGIQIKIIRMNPDTHCSIFLICSNPGLASLSCTVKTKLLRYKCSLKIIAKTCFHFRKNHSPGF